MNKLKRAFRLCFLVFLMLLASVGIGITGAAPIFGQKREQDPAIDVKTEQVDEREEESEKTIKDILE